MAQTAAATSRSVEKIRAVKDAVNAGKVVRGTLVRPADQDVLQRELLVALHDAAGPVSTEQLTATVLAQHLRLRVAAARPVEADIPALAATLAQFLAALPTEDGPWPAAVGPVYRTQQVRALLGGVSRQALADRARRHTLLALRTADGHTVYPAWQLTGGQVVPGLAEVLQTFAPDEHGELVDAWTLAAWLRQPLDELDGASVAELLVAGNRDLALMAARRAALRWSR